MAVLDEDGLEIAEFASYHEKECWHCHKRFTAKFFSTVTCPECSYRKFGIKEEQGRKRYTTRNTHFK